MSKPFSRKIWPVVMILVVGLVLVAGVPALAGQQAPEMTASQAVSGVGAAADTVDTPAELTEADKRILEEPAHAPPLAVYDGPSVVLYDNGPLVNSPGTGVGGADESVLQTVSLGMSIYGFGHQAAVVPSLWVADDFAITDPSGWTITEITFFAYQTGSTTTSTMTDVHLRIWDGPPGAGSSVIWGDTTTNLLSMTGWTNIYRVNEATSGSATDRPIMYNTATINTFLPQGTYWLDWQADGTLSSGPWAPPITINGSATTGNGMQSTDGGVTYAAAMDTGSATQQGLPFLIEGSVGNVVIPSVSLDKTVSPYGNGCPGVDVLTVAPGSDVEYCYEITNTGNITLTLHDLVDDQLGTLFTGFPFSLGPGEVNGAGVGPVTISSTTVNSATWTAYNPGPIDVAMASDTATVISAGPDPLVCNGDPVGFDAGIPPDWTVANNAPGNPVVWDSIAACGEGGNYTGGSGEAACASSDLQGGGAGLYDTELWSPPFDLTGVGSPQLKFWINYQNFAGVDHLAVDVSTDGGSSWTNLMDWNADHGSFRAAPGEMVTLDLLAYAGEPNVIVRWHYYDPTGPGTSQDWYVQLDDVSLDCVIGSGISLNKTVGLDPAVCATEDTVAVAAGTDVTYCYEVTNIGSLPLDFHNLVDNKLGTILSGFNFPLIPGASAWVTQTTTINFTTVNSATWTAYNPGPIDTATASDSASVTVRCPVGSQEVTLLSESFENGFPPAGWTLANNTTSCSGLPDWTNTDPGARGNLTGGSGLFAIADSDDCGSGSVMNAEMWSPSMDMTWMFDPQVTYYTDYNDISSASDVADLDFSLDGGATWSNILSWNEDHRGPLQVIQGFAADNQPDVMLRWNYSNATFDWWWEVDEVVVTACTGAIYLPLSAHAP